MAIAVNCQCGKQFKVKDHLAGKAVRCPACKQPLRIPGAATAARPPADGGTRAKKTTKIDKEAALLRFEAAQKQKEMNAEADAAYRDQRNKLIEGYDQAAGRVAKGKKKKGALAPVKPRKHTLFAKFADACGIVCGTLAFKYVFCAVLLSGGVVGSIYGIQRLWTYTQEQSGPPAPKEVRCEACFKRAEEAIEAKRWGEAREALGELLRIEPRFEKHRRYKGLMKKIEKGFDEG